MKFDLNQSQSTSVRISTKWTVYQYSNGAIAMKNNDTIHIKYSSGDVIALKGNGDDYQVVYILTHDGLKFIELYNPVSSD